MDMENGKKPINPIVDSNGIISNVFNLPKSLHQDFLIGLTKREYFAAMAMQGFIASHTGENLCSSEAAAKYAVDYADELLKQLEL